MYICIHTYAYMCVYIYLYRDSLKKKKKQQRVSLWWHSHEIPALGHRQEDHKFEAHLDYTEKCLKKKTFK